MGLVFVGLDDLAINFLRASRSFVPRDSGFWSICLYEGAHAVVTSIGWYSRFVSRVKWHMELRCSMRLQ